MWPPEHSSLRMEGLALRVRLGCSEEERSSPQEVRVSVEFRFKQAQVAMDSDSLEETICYGRVAEALRRLEQREFRLIERLGAAAYAEAREAAGGRAELALTVHKLHPPVAGLTGGALFRCGDFP
jgi:dihydroneopterin aldolase